MSTSMVGIGLPWLAKRVLPFLLALTSQARSEPMILESARYPLSTGKVLNYTVTSVVLVGTAAGLVAHDRFNGSLPHALGVAAIAGLLGGVAGYPRRYVFTNGAEKVIFPLLHAALGSLLLGTTGFVAGWELLDKPRGYDFPSMGFALGAAGILGGGIGGGVLGFKLAVRF